MNPKTVIKGKIHYVGVNDRNKHLFEGMWPLPNGVSYNSYLIDDETVALIDTVDICYFEVYLRKIKSIIGERPIQYLIINHMEPDHSGSIRLIKQHYPDIIIVGNKQTFGMIEGFYGVTGFEDVKAVVRVVFHQRLKRLHDVLFGPVVMLPAHEGAAAATAQQHPFADQRRQRFAQ